MRLKLVPAETSIDFFRAAKVTFGLSVVAVVTSIVLYLIMGLNLGIDFRGGTTIRTESTQIVDVGRYRDALQPLGLGDVSITEVFDPTFAADQNVAMIRIEAQEGDESVAIETVKAVQTALGAAVGGRMVVDSETPGVNADGVRGALESAGFTSAFEALNGRSRFVFGAGTSAAARAQIEDIVGQDRESGTVEVSYELIKFPSVESVGPKVSGELIQSAILSVVLAITAVLIYIWLRFEWQFSVGAVAALIHDVVVTIGIFSAFQIKFDLAIIAALLTIVGYSLNDTVVVFDRLRENLIKFKKMPLRDVMNLSVNQTLSRTVMTSGTTLIALIALLVLGGDVIRGFVFAMTWGVIVGTYSSVYVAKNIVLYLDVKRDWSKPDANAGTQFSDADG